MRSGRDSGADIIARRPRSATFFLNLPRSTWAPFSSNDGRNDDLINTQPSRLGSRFLLDDEGPRSRRRRTGEVQSLDL